MAVFETPRHLIRRNRTPSPSPTPSHHEIANIDSAAAVRAAPESSEAGTLKGRPSVGGGQLVPAAGTAFNSLKSGQGAAPLELCPSDEDSEAAREALKERKRRNEGKRKKKDDKKKGGPETIVRPRLQKDVWRRMVERDEKFEELEQEVLSWRAKMPKLRKLESENKILTQALATLEKQLEHYKK